MIVHGYCQAIGQYDPGTLSPLISGVAGEKLLEGPSFVTYKCMNQV